jgi:dTDP-4-dehydrorhamnose reductase
MTAARHAILLGASGMLGRAMAAELHRRGWEFHSVSRQQVDLANPASIGAFGRSCLHRSPEVIVNCAAWTDVDGAEVSEPAATIVNGDAVGELARLASARGAVLVNYGTDYVFGGAATKPYTTEQPREPLNAYGRSKAAGEVAMEGVPTESWLQVRTSWLYAPWGKNFVRTIRGLLTTRPAIKVVHDQRGRPTSAEHLARATLELLDRGARGIRHVTDGGECTWFEFAEEIGRLATAPGRVEPCSSAEFPRPAKRPAYSVLDLSVSEAEIGAMRDWRLNLADVVGRLEQ